jgi:dinuclear metal center YbgI/SA1388 family protein
MTLTLDSLIQKFEAWANPNWQASWDNCGWQIQPGILNQTAGVLVCLTPTLAVMQEAIALRQQGHPVNLIFAHHPLFFSPIKSIQVHAPLGEMVQLAFQHGIGIYSAHTNFDQVENGTADVLAQCLQLQHSVPLEPTQDNLGYGRVGNLPQPLSLTNLLTAIQEKLQPTDLLVSPTADPQTTIERVAVLGGSGASFIGAAVKAQAQAYLTSDCKFHQFQESRDRGLILIDAGHYATERPACAGLVQIFQSMGVTWTQLSQQDEDFRQFAIAHGQHS